MAKLNELTIDIGVTIPEDTINRCLAILNMWLTDNPDKTLMVAETRTLETRQRYLCIENVKRKNNNDMD